MFKKIIFIFVLIFVSLDLYAIGIDIGGKMGVGMGWWRGDTYSKNLDVIGSPNAIFGPYTSIEVHEHVALQFELLLAFIGNGDERRYTNYSLERYFYTIAFEAPIYLKPKFKVGPGEMFFLFGPKFLILLDDFKVDTKISISNLSHESESDFEIGRQFHLGLTFGFGYELKLGPGKLQSSFNITPYLTNYGKSYDKAIQNEFYFDVGYAYIFEK